MKRRRSTFEREASAAWIESVRRRWRACAACGAPGRVQGHHCVTQQAVRRYAATHRITGNDLAGLLWDVRNAVGLDERCHDRHTRAVARLSISVVPASAWTFAGELGLAYLLERQYAPVAA